MKWTQRNIPESKQRILRPFVVIGIVAGTQVSKTDERGYRHVRDAGGYFEHRRRHVQPVRFEPERVESSSEKVERAWMADGGRRW